MSNVKFCKKCRNKNNSDLFYSGYYSWLKDDCYECPMKDCGHKLIDINLSKEDFDIIISVSRDINFLETMIELKEKDIIEFNIKMTQFKTQIEQHATTQSQTSNILKCPTCGSTRVKRISTTAKVVGATMFGLFSKTARSQFECLDCKYKW